MALRSDKSTGGLVYSTDEGRMCPDCRQPVARCACHLKKLVPKGDGVVRVSRDTKGRGGKTVTVVTGLPLTADPLAAVAKHLRSACGAGGTVKGATVEVQGDHVDTLLAALQKLGYAAKKSGG